MYNIYALMEKGEKTKKGVKSCVANEAHRKKSVGRDNNSFEIGGLS